MQEASNEFPKIAADTLPKCLRLGVQRWGNKVYMRQKDLGIWQRFTNPDSRGVGVRNERQDWFPRREDA